MGALLGLAATYLIPLLGDAVSSLFSDDAQPAAKAITTAVAQTAIDTAAKATGITITGEASMQQAAQALQADPAKLADYQRAVNEKAIAAMKEETARLQIVNDTMRVELTSGDGFVRRMRPTWGYTMCASWAWIMVVMGVVIWQHPDLLTPNMPNIVTMFGIGLTVLGIYVNSRSKEKGAPGLSLPSISFPGRKPAR
jgi:hypothetical protein